MDDIPAIVVPGPELKSRIEQAASKLSREDLRQANKLIMKILQSSKKDEFLFLEVGHIFYPYFLSRLQEMRIHPESRPLPSTANTNRCNEESTSVDSSKDVVTAKQDTDNEKSVEYRYQEGGEGWSAELDKMLADSEEAGRRYANDPFPPLYCVDFLLRGTRIEASLFDRMITTAQYVAKYGFPFLEAIKRRHSFDINFSFLCTQDVNYEVFQSLIQSYIRILGNTPAAVETRLENWVEGFEFSNYKNAGIEYISYLCDEKLAYARAEIERQKAVLLTDDILKTKLEWEVFKVVKRFSLADLGLEVSVNSKTEAAEASVSEKSDISSEINLVPSPEEIIDEYTVSDFPSDQRRVIYVNESSETTSISNSDLYLGHIPAVNHVQEEISGALSSKKTSLADDDELVNNLLHL